MKQEQALSISTAWISAVTDIATAAAISDGLNSKKSIPAFNSHNHQIPPFDHYINYSYINRTVLIHFFWTEPHKKVKN